MPRVSVLIPATRVEYLPQAIASLLAQTYGDYEIVVGDNTGDGRLAEVVGAFRDPRIKYHWVNSSSQQENVTFLWEHSASPLIKFLYDDDFLLPFCLSTLVEAIELDPDAAFSFCRLHVVDAAGRLTKERAASTSGKAYVFSRARVLGDMLPTATNIVGEPTAALLNRTRLPGPQAMTHYDGTPIRFLVDVALWVNALREGPCVWVDDHHGAFRRHSGQLSSAASKNPDEAAGYYEWELFLRGEYAAGRLGREAALKAVSLMGRVYGHHLARLPELQPFLDGLPQLKALMEADVRELPTEAFEAALALARRG